MGFVSAKAHRVRFTTDHAAIESIFHAGGSVYKKARELAIETKNDAVAIVLREHNRTGDLASQHGWTVTNAGPARCRFTVHNDARHAIFVHGGTAEMITSTRPFGHMMVRPSPHSYFSTETPMPMVRGQKGDPWMERAMNGVLLLNGIR
jgi:hypothetical protein